MRNWKSWREHRVLDSSRELGDQGAGRVVGMDNFLVGLVLDCHLTAFRFDQVMKVPRNGTPRWGRWFWMAPPSALPDRELQDVQWGRIPRSFRSVRLSALT